MLDAMTPEIERARPLRAPRVVPDDIDLAFFCDDIDLGEKTASECAYAQGDPINLRDPWGLSTSEPGVGVPSGCEEIPGGYSCTDPGEPDPITGIPSGSGGMVVITAGAGGGAPVEQSLGGMSGTGPEVERPPPQTPSRHEEPWFGPPEREQPEPGTPWDADETARPDTGGGGGPGGPPPSSTPRISKRLIRTAGDVASGAVLGAMGLWGISKVIGGVASIGSGAFARVLITPAARAAAARELLLPGGNALGAPGRSGEHIRVMSGGAQGAQEFFQQLVELGEPLTDPRYPGRIVEIEGLGRFGYREVQSMSPGTEATIDVFSPSTVSFEKIKFEP